MTLAVTIEAREVPLPRADARQLFALQEAGGRALEERCFTAGQTVSREVQQVSILFNFLL